MWQICGEYAVSRRIAHFFLAFQAGYEGSIPFTRSIFYFNDLGGIIFQNIGKIEILATNHRSAVTRRNPRFSGALFENLWRVCGERVEMALPIRIASVSGLQWGILAVVDCHTR